MMMLLRLKEEILNQKAHNQIRHGNDIEAGISNKAKPSFVRGVVIKTLKILLGMAIFFVVIFAVAVLDEVYSGLPTTIVIVAVASIFVTIFMLCFMGERREKSQFCGRYINWIEKKNNFLHILIHYLICSIINHYMDLIVQIVSGITISRGLMKAVIITIIMVRVIQIVTTTGIQMTAGIQMILTGIAIGNI